MMATRIVVNGKSNVYDGKTIVREFMRSEADWAEETKRLLRAEMTRRGLTYDGLSERLAEIGVKESPVNLRNKVARGKFTAAFLIQCLTAMGARSLRLSEAENGQ